MSITFHRSPLTHARVAGALLGAMPADWPDKTARQLAEQIATHVLDEIIPRRVGWVESGQDKVKLPKGYKP